MGKTEGYTEGVAIFSIVVDQFGELRDVLLLEATPGELLKGETNQQAVFELFIDENGNVRMPTLRDNERSERIDEQLLVIAQDALLQWKFEPPRRRGKPVVVSVAQPIHFK